MTKQLFYLACVFVLFGCTNEAPKEDTTQQTTEEKMKKNFPIICIN